MISTHPNGEPYNVVTAVGPDLALKWLEGNVHNRPINQAHVNRLAQEIKSGRWMLTHQGIAFDTRGMLIDGQHRLWAIVEARQSVQLRVFYNEPTDNCHVLDSGERRRNVDILTITGEVGQVTVQHLATLRAMLAGVSAHLTRMMPGEESDHYKRHREAVEFAVKHLGSSQAKGLATAQTRAIIARAWYSSEAATVSHFCDVLKSGMATGDSDNVIILLRNFLMLAPGKGESVRRLRYAKTEWALHTFMKGKIPQRLCSATEELFPLPEETTQRAAS